MKQLLLIITLILLSFSVTGQETFTTQKARYEFTSVRPLSFEAEVEWLVYKDSLVMKYISAPNQIKERGRTYIAPLQQSEFEYVYELDNKKITILTKNQTAVMIEERDEFTLQKRVEIYFY